MEVVELVARSSKLEEKGISRLYTACQKVKKGKGCTLERDRGEEREKKMQRKEKNRRGCTNLVLKRCVSSWPAHIFPWLTDERTFLLSSRRENRRSTSLDVTTRQFAPVMHVRAGLHDVGQSGWVTPRLGFLFRFFPCHTHALPGTREKDRQAEKRRETNARYTRRRHLQKVEKQGRKRAVFCTIVKSTDGREIDGVAAETCVGRNDPRARVHKALSRFYSLPARLRGQHRGACP